MRLTSVLLLAFLSLTVHAKKAPFDRIEPANWWVNMKNTELQLLIHGENISEYTVSVEYSDVKLVKVHKVENPNYLFVDLDISSKAKAGMLEIQFKQGNKLRYKHLYELKERNNKPNIHQGFDASDAIYLLMPDRFSNGNPDNDSTEDTKEKANRNNPDGRHGGDLQGIINNLDYIKDLGFTTLWLNPFLENDQPAYSYHGYAISDFYKTDSRMGTNELYFELIDKLHNNGMKIIMDMIFNHCGKDHWFIEDLPMKDWIHQHDEFTRSNFRAPVISDPYASDADREKMLTGWFDSNMPDLNQRNPFVAKYLIQNSIWWIESAGLDGIRVDTQPYPYKEFMADWSKAIMAEYPTFNIVGEAWLQKIGITSYYQKDSKLSGDYNSYMPAVTDFPMFNAINAAFNEEEGWTTGMANLYYVLAQDFMYTDPSNLVIFCDNHDLNRYYESMGHDFNKYRMGLAYLLTTRGIPQIYYGTEILMDGKEHEGHGQIRKDFPGGWEGDATNAFTKGGRTEAQEAAHAFMKNLLNWRKDAKVIHEGNLKHFLPENGVYVYFRYTKAEAVMVILNNKEEKQSLDTERFNEVLNGYSKGKDIISGKSIDKLQKIELDKKSVMVIELRK